MTVKILLVDDDTELTELLEQYLQSEGFDTETACDGEDGVKKALTKSYDAIILDIMLPKLNGFEVLKKIRAYKQVPVIMLTAKGDDIDKIVGLEIGADDYLPKPCNPRELIARIKAVLRRTYNQHTSSKQVIEFQHLKVDTGKHLAYQNDKELILTNAEFKILEILIKSPGQAFSKEELTQYALGRKFTAFDRSIDVHISNLRTKLGNNNQNNPFIKTVRGFGYLFDA